MLVVVGCSAATSTSTPIEPAETTSSAIAETSAPTSLGPTSAPSTSVATTAPVVGPVVVIMPTGLPDDFTQVVMELDGVEAAAVIHSGQMRLVGSSTAAGLVADDPPPGFVIPIEATVFDTPSSAAIFSDELAEALAEVGPTEVLLSESSAALRGLTVGATMTFEPDSQFRVAVVAPDRVAGTTEAIFVGTESSALPAPRRRAAIVNYRGEVADLEAGLGRSFDDDLRVLDRRDGSRSDRQRVTLAQIVVKEIFGEFAFRPRGGGQVEIDPAWTDANLVTRSIPLLGEIKCHRVFAALLNEVMTSLVADGLNDVIDARAYQGCWNPRFIAGTDRLSRHAWGIAADINFGNPLDGSAGSPVHQELLDRMLEAGATSGHRWTVPDPGHFEYVGPGP